MDPLQSAGAKIGQRLQNRQIFLVVSIGLVALSRDHTSITVNLSWAGLTSNAISAHIHGPAVAGVNGPIIFPMAGVSSTTTGSITTQTFSITPAQVAQLRAGLFYFNVHSTNFPNGEIRGQILPTCSAARADFDGDGKTDLSVFRAAEGNWYINRSGAGLIGVNFGLNGDVPMPGDYDGDGRTDLAVFRGSPTGAEPDYYVLNSATNTVTYSYWGVQTDTPLVGDYDGDGKTDISVYRASNNTYYIEQSSGGTQSLNFGTAGDVPMMMDYEGDGRSNLAVFRPSNGTWYVSKPTGTPAQNFYAIPFGLAGDMPVPADYDGDDQDDLAVFRPSTGVWYTLRSSGGIGARYFGLSSDVPVPGDYDGDGKDDIAVYRGGVWYLDRSQSGFGAFQYGLSTDVPIPRRYIP